MKFREYRAVPQDGRIGGWRVVEPAPRGGIRVVIQDLRSQAAAEQAAGALEQAQADFCRDNNIDVPGRPRS